MEPNVGNNPALRLEATEVDVVITVQINEGSGNLTFT